MPLIQWIFQSLPQTHNLALNEAVAAADAYAVTQIQNEALAEAVVASDSLAVAQIQNEALSEAVAAADALSVAQVHAPALAEAVAAADAFAVAQTHAATLAEAVAAADSMAVTAIYETALAEAVAASDSFAAGTIISVALAEAVAAADNYAADVVTPAPTPPSPPPPATGTPSPGGGSSGGSGAWISAGGSAPGQGLTTEFLLAATGQLRPMATRAVLPTAQPTRSSGLAPLALGTLGLGALLKALAGSAVKALPLAEVDFGRAQETEKAKARIRRTPPADHCESCGHVFSGRGSGAHQRRAHVEACRVWHCACGFSAAGTNARLRAAGWRFSLGPALAVCPACRLKGRSR